MAPAITRLPALPLIVNDPYFSIWCPADRLTDVDSAHWAGEVKPLRGTVKIDGENYRFLGAGKETAMETVALTVTPTATESVFVAGGVRLTLRFTTPLLLDQPDILSMPVTYVDVVAESEDGADHRVAVKFFMSSALCYSGAKRKPVVTQQYEADGMQIAFTGQVRQGILNHSGDHTTIDWGYLYLAAASGVSGNTRGLTASASGKVSAAGAKVAVHALAAYDDVASINYFGKLCPAYYARNGKTIRDALKTFHDREAELKAACEALDKQLLNDAEALGGEDYRLIAAAAYRHAIGAHKLIADERGDMVFLSKENDSNGCIGTVDVSYPSIPLFLLYNAEFVRGMCRPVLKFASTPVWTYDFAPHDVGRYPYAVGQVYGVRAPKGIGGLGVHPPYFLYPAESDIYVHRSQMPVEESGNMLLMLYAAAKSDGDYTLIREHADLLSSWVKYLIEYGEDPGEQLCTDDFAGHLAHNINLSAKAITGVAAYALIQKGLGNDSAYAEYMEKARAMAKSWLDRANAGGYTYLTFDQQGWSMKYNMVWDRLLNPKLLPDSFYREETESYLNRMNDYGLPLDSRADYTKSDWILWTASMADGATFKKLIAPVARFLRESESRVAFSDWYNTKTGKYVAFIGRSVQGGLYMPLLARKWRR